MMIFFYHELVVRIEVVSLHYVVVGNVPFDHQLTD
jgi:hypothetical protein